MANKRTRIEIATISVSAYRNGKKWSNTFNWRVFTMDERNTEELFEKERIKIEKGIAEKYHSQYPQSDCEIIAKISKIERHYVDSFASNDAEQIGNSRKTEAKITIKGR